MKKVLVIVASLPAMLMPGLALAAPANVSTYGSFQTFVVPIVNGLLGISGVIVLALLIFGAFQYVSSAGNEDQIEAAKKNIMAAIIGLVIVAAAFVIMNTVASLLPTNVLK